MTAHNAQDLLEKLRDDYIQSVRENDSDDVATFIERFLLSSWHYNEQHMNDIKAVFSSYEQGQLSKQTFSHLFNEMVKHLHSKLEKLDTKHDYPLLHTQDRAAIIVSLVDGLVVQYYISAYDVNDLKEVTPHLTPVILQALKTESHT
ncbi:hypothetical protein GCM10008929_03190 [Alkalibacterium psychrotolerans]